MPLDIICMGNCGEIYYETNDKDGFNQFKTGVKSDFVRKYDPDKMANAAMIRLKEEFVGSIDDIPHDVDLLSEGIGPCTCGNPFSNDDFNFITRPQEIDEAVAEDIPEEELVCHGCGMDHFKTPRGLKVHQDKYCKAKHLKKTAA